MWKEDVFLKIIWLINLTPEGEMEMDMEKSEIVGY